MAGTPHPGIGDRAAKGWTPTHFTHLHSSLSKGNLRSISYAIEFEVSIYQYFAGVDRLESRQIASYPAQPCRLRPGIKGKSGSDRALSLSYLFVKKYQTINLIFLFLPWRLFIYRSMPKNFAKRFAHP
jgi:hypothetical protein